MGFLRLVGIPENLFLFICFFFQFHNALADLVLGQHELRRRVDGDTLQFLDGTLAQNIETADGFHFVAPQLDTVRILLRQVKNVHNAATDGELSRALHLVSLLISHCHQPGCQFAFIQTAAPLGTDDVLLLPQHLGCHQRRIGSDDGNGLPFHDSAQCLDPLLYQLITVDIRLEKDQILCRIQHDISVIKAVFLVDLFGF